MQRTISIIVPVYNLECCIDKTIKNIVAQTYSDIEIIIIDDGSSDKTLLICRQWETKDSRIKVLHQENKGVSAARNRGIDEANGDFICFVDGDDLIDKFMLEKLSDGISHSDLSICGLRYYDEIKKNENNEKVIIDSEKAIRLLCDNDVISYSACAKLYRSDLVKTLRFDVNTGILEDYLFVCNYITRCKNITVIPEYLYFYVKRENSALGRAFSHKRLDLIYSYRESIKLLTNCLPNTVPYIYGCYKTELIELLYRIPQNEEFEDDKEIIVRELTRIRDQKIKGNLKRVIKIKLFDISPILYRNVIGCYRKKCN